MEFCIEREKYETNYTLFLFRWVKNNNEVGYGVRIPKVEFNLSSRLPDYVSICSAELAAIHMAV